MTDNEKARDLLAMIKVKEPGEFIVNSWWGSFVNDYKEALQMAIKALEQQPCEDCIRREEALMALTGDITDCTIEEFIARLRDKLSKLPSVNAITDDDCISRQAVLALPTSKTRTLSGEIVEEEVNIELIKALPSVIPKEKTRWIPVSERLPEEYGEYICTMSNDNVQECGFIPSGEKGLIPGWSTCEADGFKKLDYRDIKAWMPLPEPYKAESEG